MSHDVRELLQDAASDVQGPLDVEDLRRRGRRVQRRRQAAAVASVVGVAVLAITGVVLGPGRGDRPDVAVEDGPSGPAADVPRQVVAEGPLGDTGDRWTLRAWTTSDPGRLCVQGPIGSSCAEGTGRAGETFLASSGVHDHEGQVFGCVNGAVGPAAASVMVQFGDGEEQTLTPELNETFDLRFFGHCRAGLHLVESIVVVDATGQTLHESTSGPLEPAQDLVATAIALAAVESLELSDLPAGAEIEALRDALSEATAPHGISHVLPGRWGRTWQEESQPLRVAASGAVYPGEDQEPYCMIVAVSSDGSVAGVPATGDAYDGCSEVTPAIPTRDPLLEDL